MSNDIRRTILGADADRPREREPDPLEVAEGLLQDAQRSITAARVILRQFRQQSQGGAPGLSEPCPHPPKQQIDTSTLTRYEKTCGVCGAVVEGRDLIEPESP